MPCFSCSGVHSLCMPTAYSSCTSPMQLMSRRQYSISQYMHFVLAFFNFVSFPLVFETLIAARWFSFSAFSFFLFSWRVIFSASAFSFSSFCLTFAAYASLEVRMKKLLSKIARTFLVHVRLWHHQNVTVAVSLLCSVLTNTGLRIWTVDCGVEFPCNV